MSRQRPDCLPTTWEPLAPGRGLTVIESRAGAPEKVSELAEPLDRPTWTEIVPGLEPVGGKETVVAPWPLTLRVPVRALEVLLVYETSTTLMPVFPATTPEKPEVPVYVLPAASVPPVTESMTEPPAGTLVV